jgi:hypothetical protein
MRCFFTGNPKSWLGQRVGWEVEIPIHGHFEIKNRREEDSNLRYLSAYIAFEATAFDHSAISPE